MTRDEAKAFVKVVDEFLAHDGCCGEDANWLSILETLVPVSTRVLTTGIKVLSKGSST